MTQDNRLGLGILILNCTLVVMYRISDPTDIIIKIVTSFGVMFGFYLLTKKDGKEE
jgi:hypothetical protein